MSAIGTIIILAVVVEALTEIVGRMGGLMQKIPTQAVSIVIGISIAVAYDADLLFALGVCAHVPVVGCVATGIIISRGSNYLHQLLVRFGAVRTRTGNNVGAATSDTDAQDTTTS